MNSTRRSALKLFAGIAAGLTVSHAAHALNPQPEVPSKPAQDGRTNPKALNPQPEVPSKAKKKKKPKEPPKKP